jgi:hypothetical protein
MIKICDYSCENKREAELKEDEYMTELKVNMNMKRASRTQQQFREDNREKIQEYYEDNKEKLQEYKKEYNKEYRDNNKERIQEYRENNKEKINQQNKEYYETNKSTI